MSSVFFGPSTSDFLGRTGWRNLRIGRIRNVVRRHNLHARLVKRFLNLHVERTRNRRPLAGVFQTEKQVVLHRKIVEGRLPDFRGGFLEHLLHLARGGEEEFVHLLPGGVVADAY